MKPSSQLLMKEHGDGYPSIAKEKTNGTENFLAARINGANPRTFSCSTPIKTSFGIPSQLQTPISKLSHLSASGHKHSECASGRAVNEDGSATRTPFKMLAGENQGGPLFSPLRTPLPIKVPSIFDKIVSPALKGHVKRVLVMPPTLSPARRVPVRRRRSELMMTTGKQSLFTMPKSSREDNSGFMTPVKVSRADNGILATPKSSVVESELNATKRHGNKSHTPVSCAKESLGGSELPKRMVSLASARALVATPSSSRVEHLLQGAQQSNGFFKAEVVQPHNVTHGRKPIDGPDCAKKAITCLPQLSSAARRVPVHQKEKKLITAPSSNCVNVPPQPARGKSGPQQASKASKSGRVRGKTCGGDEVEAIRKPDAASHQNTMERLERRMVNRIGGKAADKAEHQTLRTFKKKSHSSKGCVDLIERVPKVKGQQTGAGKAKHQRIRNHQIKSHSSKQENGVSGKTNTNGSSFGDITDVRQDHEEGGKVDEVCDASAWKDHNTMQHCDAKFGSNEGQHDNEIGMKHQEDLGGYGSSEIKDGTADKNQTVDGHVAVGSSYDKANLDKKSSKSHSRDEKAIAEKIT